jgi:putative transposase
MQGIYVNSVIEWAGTPRPRYDRILRIDSASATVAVIDVTDTAGDDSVKPIVLLHDALEQALSTSKARIVDHDPYREKLRPKVELTEQEKAEVEKIWKIIEPIVNHSDVFDPRVCGRLISDAATKSELNPKLVRRYVRRFWRGGQVQVVLLPRYYRCGTVRQRDHQKDYKKLGRKRTEETALGSPVGVNMDPVAEGHCLTSIKLFFENEKGRSLRYAYQKMLEVFYHRGKYEKHGVKDIPLLPDPDEVPSYDQFRYCYKKHQDIVVATRAREGQHAFDLKHRAIPGNSTLDADGPGHIVQLDPTLGDIYLVSEFDRTRIIGRPVIYIIVDVFSHLIIGMAVCLDAPSWRAVMQALENMVRNKVEFCREYGFTITEADWPSHQLPSSIIADRGELLSKNSDALGEKLRIKVINTAPYRPDWKAIVERYFRLINDVVIDWAPGAIREYLPRSGNDYRLDARLTLYELRQLLVGCILEHNMAHKMEGYPRDKDMYADGVQPYPARLWEWGIANRSGYLKEQPPAAVRMQLLPGDRAWVTPEGIHFKGLSYECERAWNEKWFEKARIAGSWPVAMAYDYRTVSRIYLRLDEGRQIEECTLMPKDQIWAAFDWQDIKDRRAWDKVLAKEPEQQAQQAKIEIQAKQKQIIRDARKKTMAARKGFSNAELLSGIDENRADERKREDQKALQAAGITPLPPGSASSLLTQEEVEDDAFMAEKARWLRTMRDGGSENAQQ